LRKIMLLAAVMAMVLAAAAPAFAQASAVGGSVQYVDCDQIQAAVTGQYNTDNEQMLAGIAQELGVSQNQVLACFESIAAGEDVNINTATPAPAKATAKAPKPAPAKATAPAPKAAASPTATATATATAAAATTAPAPASAPAELPPTGGASLIALGAGALLVAGGLLARRIVR
jgi:cell division septation protein DedD